MLMDPDVIPMKVQRYDNTSHRWFYESSDITLHSQIEWGYVLRGISDTFQSELNESHEYLEYIAFLNVIGMKVRGMSHEEHA